MRKQIGRTISILTVLVALFVGSINAWASGGACSVPSCRPNQLAAQSQSLSFDESFLVLRAMSFLIWL